MRVLLTFTGFHDPYSLGLVGDEQQAGPVVSLAQVKPFDHVMLISTSNTRQNTTKTKAVLTALKPDLGISVVVIDGDTFEVENGWKWNGQSGSRVRPTGYDAPEINTNAGQQAKQKLVRLIQGKVVNLAKAHTIDRGRPVCDVFYNGRNLADYFKEYQ